MRDLPRDFRPDHCTGCLDSSVSRERFFAIRFQLAGRATYRNSSLYQRELQRYRLTFSYPMICQHSYPKAIKLDVRVFI